MSGKRNKHYYANFFLSFLFILSVALVAVGIHVYRRTVISSWVLFIVTLFGSGVGCYFLWNYSKLVMSKFFSTFSSCVIGGGIAYYFFLFLNNHFASNVMLTNNFSILRYGTLAKGRGSSCSQPYFIISFKGQEKQLVFNCNLQYAPEDYKSVELIYQKGLFGFYCIREMKLKTE
jgi:phosphate/sulfate permease